MDSEQARFLAVCGLVVFCGMVTWWVATNRKDLTCKCRHYQTEHRLNFGLGGSCERCDCQIFEEIRDFRF